MGTLGERFVFAGRLHVEFNAENKAVRDWLTVFTIARSVEKVIDHLIFTARSV